MKRPGRGDLAGCASCPPPPPPARLWGLWAHESVQLVVARVLVRCMVIYRTVLTAPGPCTPGVG
jgi:hypothetical protein